MSEYGTSRPSPSPSPCPCAPLHAHFPFSCAVNRRDGAQPVIAGAAPLRLRYPAAPALASRRRSSQYLPSDVRRIFTLSPSPEDVRSFDNVAAGSQQRHRDVISGDLQREGTGYIYFETLSVKLTQLSQLASSTHARARAREFESPPRNARGIYFSESLTRRPHLSVTRSSQPWAEKALTTFRSFSASRTGP